jgi:hypothetical protein
VKDGLRDLVGVAFNFLLGLWVGGSGSEEVGSDRAREVLTARKDYRLDGNRVCHVVDGEAVLEWPGVYLGARAFDSGRFTLLQSLISKATMI